MEAFLYLTVIFLLTYTNGQDFEHEIEDYGGNEMIIGGRMSDKGRWPWLVSLHRHRPLEGGIYRHSCGASLILPNWVLTAAHCVSSSNYSDYKVNLGMFNQTIGDQEQSIPIKQIIRHAEYGRRQPGIPNDIALIELMYSADLESPNVGLLQLPRLDDKFAGNTECWVAGWGRMNATVWRSASPVLLEVNTAIHTLEECREIWRRFRGTNTTNILDQHICVGLPDRGGCHGDSGSPAVCDMTGRGDWVAAGFNSWGTGRRCAAATNAFVRISYFLSWIRQRVPGLPGVKASQPSWS